MEGMNLKLQAGTDIPVPQIGVSIHQPTIKEIAFVGEENFYMGCEMLTFSKQRLPFQEQQKLEKFSDFEILISILTNKEMSLDTMGAFLVLQLIFPNASINFEYNAIQIIEDEEIKKIDKTNFHIFKSLLTLIFCLSQNQQKEYRAGNEKAQELIDKFKKSKQKIAQDRGENQDFDILGRYISILTVGEHRDMNSFLNYTVYQLFDEFERFTRKQNHDIYLSAKLSFGGSDMEEPDNWMDSLRNNSKKDELLS